MRASIIIVALLCAVAPAMAQPAPDVAALVRRDVTLASPVTLEGAALSPLRPTAGPQPGDSFACLRLAGPPAFIAVFFEAGAVVGYRRAVALDGCETVAYAGLSAGPKMAAKPASNRKNRPDPARATATALPTRQ
jgi:hypothetical protein